MRANVLRMKSYTLVSIRCMHTDASHDLSLEENVVGLGITLEIVSKCCYSPRDIALVMQTPAKKAKARWNIRCDRWVGSA